MSDQKRVNGNLYSKNSATIKIEGEVFEGWDSIEFGDKRERPFAFGAAKHGGPRGRTKGRYTPDPLIITAQADTARDIRDKLAGLSPDGASIGEPEVLITLTLSESKLGVSLVEFEACALTEMSDPIEDSAEHSTVKLTFQPMRIKRDGQTLYDSSVAGA